MRISKDDVYVRMQIPGAVIRQQGKLGSVKGFDTIIMFSPEHAHSVVVDQMIQKTKA